MDRDLKHQFGCFLAQILSENLFLSNAAGRKNKQGWEYLVSLWGESSKSKCSSCCRICPIDPKADASLMTATGVVMPPILLLLVSVQTLKENLYGKRSYLCSKQHLKTWTRILCMCQFGCLILLVLLCQWRKIINTECLIYHGLQSVSALLAPKKREREKKSWKASVIGPLNGCYQLLSLPLILPVGKLFPQLQGAVGCCQFI